MMRFGVLVFALVAVSVGQTSVYVPDPSPTAGAACNAIPFGSLFSTGYTYVARIPAGNLSSGTSRLMDIGFADCTTTGGTWTAPNFFLAVGHVPNPLPGTFNFPGPGGATLGSFLDLTVIWDSATQGPFNWTIGTASWSLMGISAMGGTMFCWNGVNDIGIYVTYQNSVATGGVGTLYRTATEPFRLYSAGYQAAASAGSGNNGLKMQLDFSGCGAPEYQVNQPGSTLSFDNAIGTAFSVGAITRPQNTVFTIASSSVNMIASWEVIAGFSAAVPASNGGLMTADGQLVNIFFGAPFTFLNGGVFPALAPYPGSFTLPVNSGPNSATITFQQAITDPIWPGGVAFSQPSQITIQ